MDEKKNEVTAEVETVETNELNSGISEGVTSPETDISESSENTAEVTEATEAVSETPAAEHAAEPAKPVKKRKRKQLRLWVRILLASIAALIAFLLFMYIMGGAVLQESYKLAPPTAEEIASAKVDPGIYGWLVLDYDHH